MSLLVRYRAGDSTKVGVQRDDGVFPLPFTSMAEALRLPVERLREDVETALGGSSIPLGAVELLAPVDGQEVWAAGVEPADLLFRCTGQRVVAQGQAVGVPADSGRNLPAPEVAMVLNAHAQIAGFTVGDDVSGRDAGSGSCALGPGIRPAWELPPQPVFEIDLGVARGGEIVEQGSTDTEGMSRDWEELVVWVTNRAVDLSDGAVLMSGTGIVPSSDFSLQEGDEVTIHVQGIGTLRNHVATVGSNSRG